MKTCLRRALLLTLLPALAACGHATSTTVKPKAKTRAAAVKVVKVPVPEGRATVVTGAVPLAMPTGAPPARAPGVVHAQGSVMVSGNVFNDDGALVDGVTVYAHSLEAAHPYTSSATTQGGVYILKDVPQGTNIELIAGAREWTSRRQVRSFSADAIEWNRCDFGSVAGDAASDGAAYFLSNRPEIQVIDPGDADGKVDASLSVIRLSLSEALDAANRLRFERALRVLPANDVANHGAMGTTLDLTTLVGAAYPIAQAIDGTMPYDVRKGSVFMQDLTRGANFIWSTDGTEVAFTLPGPLLSNVRETAAYQVALVSGGPDQAIRDVDGNVLGSDTDGRNQSTYPAAGTLVPATIYNHAARLVPVAGFDGANGRWAATHQPSTRFLVADGGGNLALDSVRVVTVGQDTRMALKFTLPMAAYSGTGAGFSDASVSGAEALSHLTFALGATPDDLNGVTLDRDVQLAPVDPRNLASLGDTATFGKRFRFDPAAFVAVAAGAPAGSITVAVDPENAQQVLLTIVGKPHFFDTAASFLATRAVGVLDAAGHRAEDSSTPAAGVRTTL